MELIRLTALGTWAVHARLLDSGRDAPLVGELAHAPAAGLLGTLAEHYDPESAHTELTSWIESHGGPEAAHRRLLDAVRAMPYRSRAQAMLDTLLAALPDGEGERLVRSLRTDPQLAPLAVGALTGRDLLSPEDLTETESLIMVAEGMLQLLEISGPDGFAQAVLAQGPDFRNAIEAALVSLHPDHEALQELRDIARRLPRSRGVRAGRTGRSGLGSNRRRVRRR
ncbi:hypothetical protein GCM10020367_55550 [Streptomyces sannanensis]|uniref:HEAT repeat domain-containing protein n=1 Tax=Streptomyces sannanensis TaxID=285536 RepID=A0ABP6SJ31_9ACTN